MKFQVTVGREARSVELQRGRDGWECWVEGERRAVDVAEVGPGVLSLLLDGESFTVRLERSGESYRVHTRGADLVAAVEDPRRWAGGRSSALNRAGPQEVTAPMPGKVISVLVQEKAEVEAGQGLVVVEAMKMQNEIPSPKGGVIEKILVREGDRVEHGQALALVV